MVDECAEGGRGVRDCRTTGNGGGDERKRETAHDTRPLREDRGRQDEAVDGARWTARRRDRGQRRRLRACSDGLTWRNVIPLDGARGSGGGDGLWKDEMGMGAG